MPHCVRCRETKPDEAFCFLKVKSVLDCFCRSCRAAYHREWRQSAKGREVWKSHRRRIIRDQKDKELARQRCRYAIEQGRLTPGACEVGVACNGPIEAHHDDYNKALEVRWFCRLHHRQQDAPKTGIQSRRKRAATS